MFVVIDLVLRSAKQARREIAGLLGLPEVSERQFYAWRGLVHDIMARSENAVLYADDSEKPRLLMRGYEDFDTKLILTIGHLVRKFRNKDVASALFDVLVKDTNFKLFLTDEFSLENYYDQLCSRYPKD